MLNDIEKIANWVKKASYDKSDIHKLLFIWKIIKI